MSLRSLDCLNPLTCKDEPIEAAWSGSGLGNEPVTSIVTDCSDEGCSNVTRTIDRHVYYDGSIMEAHEVEEHIAGENCESQNGYSGWTISVSRMLAIFAW